MNRVESAKLEITSEENRSYIYTYYVVERKDILEEFNEEATFYGITITSNGKEFDYYEEESILDITISREKILLAMETLIRNAVSPINLKEIMSDGII